jgi:DNA polymerase-1
MLDELRMAGVQRGDIVALVLKNGVGLGVAAAGQRWATATAEPAEVVQAIEAAIRPRWVLWSKETTSELVAADVRIASCWDIATVHRLLFGGWRAEPARVVATLADLPMSGVPTMGQLNLLDVGGEEGSDLENPLRPDGHLRPEWTSGGWGASVERMSLWATTALSIQARQRQRLSDLDSPLRAAAAARSESAAELLCAELEADGLPIDVLRAAEIIQSFVGARTTNEADAAANRVRRDAEVLRYVPASTDIDLRSPAGVKSLLNRVGVDVPNTRAHRLEPYRDAHPVVGALLTWRKAERISTTYGYSWLDEHVAGGRLRGAWTGSDGAAGRMTAQAGLHNLPADMRDSVAAEPGFVFVRADLGQIEPRVLAAISGDRQFAAATQADDMYAPVAARLGVERAIAKVAILAAMYGQTSGTAGQALRGLEDAYPVAMGYLRDADEAGRDERNLRTYGGRLIRMWATPDHVAESDRRSVANARGRFARNAMVQGAAAELFKAWAATVRARVAVHGARIVLCLHDELLVHAPHDAGSMVALLLDQCLQEAASRWAPDRSVRFVADISVIRRWSEAKP